jgi:hypothetical protein
MNRNLVGSIYGRSSIKIAIIRPDMLASMAATGGNIPPYLCGCTYKRWRSLQNHNINNTKEEI